MLEAGGASIVAKEAASSQALAIEVTGDGLALRAVAGTVASLGARVTWISILDPGREVETILVELDGVASADRLVRGLEALPHVLSVKQQHTLQHVFGKRIIIIGGGAQVGQVALGAVSEADRHNLRGERISVDTIPLVGERRIAEAVRATVRLPRVDAIVLAGALMGGEIEDAVCAAQRRGMLVVSLNMAGTVPKVADLVVTDPVQAGVMAVMAVAHTARFDVKRLRDRHF